MVRRSIASLLINRIPYDVARQVCLQKCYKIRNYLAPIFGPDFVDQCVPPDQHNGQKKRPAGRRPKSPPLLSRKRPSDGLDDESDGDQVYPISNKRIAYSPCASGSSNPPALPSDVDWSSLGRLSEEDICTMFSAARELMRMRNCPFTGPPKNDWPMPGDPRMGGYVYINRERYKWDGAKELKPRPIVHILPTSTLQSLHELNQPQSSVPVTQRNRYPITPSPHQSPFAPPPMDCKSPVSASSRTMISPPMSVREGFSGYTRDRQYSLNSNDDCRTPIRESYTPLFPTPQPEN
jgi:hypothetical protein